MMPENEFPQNVTNTLKLLVISAHFPPHHLGGYEIRVKNIIDELNRRGYEILVITTKEDHPKKGLAQGTNYPVIRCLYFNTMNPGLIKRMTTWKYLRQLGLILNFMRTLFFDIRDLKRIEYQLIHFRPDVVYLGQILSITKSLLPYLACSKANIIVDDGGGTLPYLHDNKGLWINYVEKYESKFSIINLTKPIINYIVTKLSGNRIKSRWAWPDNMEVMFKREVNQKTATDKGIPIKNSYVLHSGIDLKQLVFQSNRIFKSPIKIIYPARIEPKKGQMDAIKLLAKLLENGIEANLFLIGELRKSFLPDLRKEIEIHGVENHLTFVPMVAYAEMPAWYQNADICFFPSYWKDGFSRVTLEAMACGSIVISYGNEGSNEIIRSRENGFLVNPEDYVGIVQIVKELVSNPQVVSKIRLQARRDVEESYSMTPYIDQIEEIIQETASQKSEQQ